MELTDFEALSFDCYGTLIDWEAGLLTVWIDRRRDRDGWGATPPPPAPVTPDWEFGSMAAFAAAAAAR